MKGPPSVKSVDRLVKDVISKDMTVSLPSPEGVVTTRSIENEDVLPPWTKHRASSSPNQLKLSIQITIPKILSLVQMKRRTMTLSMEAYKIHWKHFRCFRERQRIADFPKTSNKHRTMIGTMKESWTVPLRVLVEHQREQMHSRTVLTRMRCSHTNQSWMVH